MKKIKVEPYRGVRNDANCRGCSLGWDIHGKNTLSEIRSHVRKTGHEVVRVYGPEFIYNLDET